MALVGIQLDRKNPPYSIADFTFWMPQFKEFMTTDEGKTMFDNLYEMANSKIFKSIYGADWKLAMSYCIAHYATLIAQQDQMPAGDTLDSIAGGGEEYPVDEMLDEEDLGHICEYCYEAIRSRGEPLRINHK